MKVLWFTTIRLADTPMFSSGTWIEGMSDALRDHHPEVDLVNVCMEPRIKGVLTEQVRGRKQVVVPLFSKLTTGFIKIAKDILDAEKPDVIEVWGVESAWGLLPFDVIAPGVPSILGMQGVMTTVRDNVYADLTSVDLLGTVGIKELLHPQSSLFRSKWVYGRLAEREKIIIKSFKYISSQSEWVTTHIKAINPEARIFPMKIALRSPYYTAPRWNIDKADKYSIFATAIMNSPLKGIYTLLRAFNEVRKVEPRAMLELAGFYQVGIRRSGFHRMMERYMRRHCLTDSVTFHGQMATPDLIDLALSCRMYVNPSFVESYSLTTAEATYLGVPSIVSCVGTMPELDGNGGIMFFPKGDYMALADDMLKVISDDGFAVEISDKSRANAELRNDRGAVVKAEMELYCGV